jgi:hypothetical protein
MSNNSPKVSLKQSHSVLLGKGHFLKLVSIDNIDDGLSFFLVAIGSLIISCSKQIVNNQSSILFINFTYQQFARSLIPWL